MGKSLDFARSLIRALESGGDAVTRWGTVGKCTGYGAWLLLDTIQWVRPIDGAGEQCR